MFEQIALIVGYIVIILAEILAIFIMAEIINYSWNHFTGKFIWSRRICDFLRVYINEWEYFCQYGRRKEGK